MNRNEQPTSGQALEAVCLLLDAWNPKAANRIFVKNYGSSVSRVRIMATGAIFYVGAASIIMTGTLIQNKFGMAVRRLLSLYEDAPRIVRDPWEMAVRRMAYVVRDEPDPELHKRCANELWNNLPPVVKWAIDPEWQQQILVTGAMITMLRKIKAYNKPYEPAPFCRMSRKLYRARLLSRSVRHTRNRKVPIIRYRLTPKGHKLLDKLDADQPSRNSGNDKAGARAHAATPNRYL